ncbi:MAG: hypothetical protein ACFCUX_04100 [Candidatus Methylacidiphilales bacterium]
MEFDWNLFKGVGVTLDEVAEGFEDPFSLRFLPDSGTIAERSRFFLLGKSLGGKSIFAVYKSTGKLVSVITARPMSEEEDFFYSRKCQEAL